LRSQYNPRTEEAILRLSRQAKELGSLYQAHAAALLAEAVGISGHSLVVDVARLRSEPEPLVREVLRRAWRQAGWPEQQMSDYAWRTLSQLLHAGSTRIDLPGGIEVEVSREAMRLVRTPR
jgi:tRNA(Ile)-lysidine synthase